MAIYRTHTDVTHVSFLWEATKPKLADGVRWGR